MTDRRFTELMNAALDGHISPEDAGRLRDYLATDSDAARRYEELKQVGSFLSDSDAESPPPGLRSAILAAVADLERARRHPGYVERFMAALSPRPRVRYAYAFATGAVLAVCVFVVVSVTAPGVVVLPGGSDELYGTLGIGNAGRRFTEPVEFCAPGACGSVGVAFDGSRVTLDLSLSSRSELEVVIGHVPDVSFEAMGALQDGSHAVRASGRSVELTHAGDRDYRFLFADPSGDRRPLHIRVTSGDSLVFDCTVPPERDQP